MVSLNLTDTMNPLVSVFMITYNHERFIRQSIDSVLSQETSFEYEIVIGDDASSDNTSKILREYEQRFPDKIKLKVNDRNLGAMKNHIATLSRCNGKYIALLEGDDYWVDQSKLQKQIELMEQRPDIILCSGEILDNAAKVSARSVDKTFDSLDVLIGNPFFTCTVVIRNHPVLHELRNYEDSPIGDWLMYVLLAQATPESKWVKLRNVFSHYRVHEQGSLSMINPRKQAQKSIHTSKLACGIVTPILRQLYLPEIVLNNDLSCDISRLNESILNWRVPDSSQIGYDYINVCYSLSILLINEPNFVKFTSEANKLYQMALSADKHKLASFIFNKWYLLRWSFNTSIFDWLRITRYSIYYHRDFTFFDSLYLYRQSRN